MRMTINIPKWYHDKLKEIKELKGVSYTDTILRALDSQFEKGEQK